MSRFSPQRIRARKAAETRRAGGPVRSVVRVVQRQVGPSSSYLRWCDVLECGHEFPTPGNAFVGRVGQRRRCPECEP